MALQFTEVHKYLIRKQKVSDLGSDFHKVDVVCLERGNRLKRRDLTYDARI